jgi:DNA-binding MarR family transcriptional regulator
MTSRRPPSPTGTAVALDSFVPFNLGVIFNHVSRDMSRLYRENFGIGLTEGRIIITLATDESMSANDLSGRFGIDKGVMSRSIAKLIKKSLVSARPDPRNARRLILSLTARGHAINERAVPLVYEVQENLLSALSEPDVREIRRLLMLLRHSLEGADITD